MLIRAQLRAEEGRTDTHRPENRNRERKRMKKQREKKGWREGGLWNQIFGS